MGSERTNQRSTNEGFAAIAPNLFTRHSDLLTEKNIAKAMIPMFSMPRDKRNDSTAIQELENMSETDLSGREAFEKIMTNELQSY